MNLVVRVVRVIRVLRVIRVSWGGKSDWAGEIRSRDHSCRRKRAIEKSRPGKSGLRMMYFGGEHTPSKGGTGKNIIFVI